MLNLFSIPIFNKTDVLNKGYLNELLDYLNAIWDNNKLNDLTCNWALETSSENPNNAKSTARLDNYSLHKNQLFSEAVKQIEENVRNYWNLLGFRKNSTPVITDMWANMHSLSGETGLHNHGGSTLSGALYLSAPPKSGNIKFLNPLELVWFQAPHQIDFDFRYEELKKEKQLQTPLDYYKEVVIQDNMLLIWPSWLKHKTDKNLTNKRRNVISFNVSVK